MAIKERAWTGVLLLGALVALATGCSERGDAPVSGRATAAAPATAAERPARPRGAAPQMQFRVQPVVDQQQGGLVVATITLPQSWKFASRVEWRYQDVSHPVRVGARAEAPDGSAWVEFFPNELFYWGEPALPFPVGSRNLGMIHAPHIRVQDAMRHFVVGPYRGRMPNLEVVRARPVKGLFEAFGLPPSPGEAMAVRLRYTVGGRPADEDVFAQLGRGDRVPYTGPLGTWYENHRPLVLGHAIGATGGLLDSMYPLLGFIATSVKADPAWQAHRERVRQQIAAAFDRYIAQGYEAIAAAGRMSAEISRGNDAMLASMQAQRQAQAQRDAARRAAGSGSRSTSDDFSLYIRGTERMKDPYWGESEQSYHQRYHWTDGHGNYRSSNDAGFNPNIGAGGGPTWQRMEPAPR